MSLFRLSRLSPKEVKPRVDLMSRVVILPAWAKEVRLKLL